ncbi:MAG: CheY-like chemotaxis protein [Myxococcota bacterium]|jgi:CheY-like chemotaxis protein
MPFDLAIIDLHMPDTNRIEFSQTIQTTQKAGPLPALLMTSVGFNVGRSAYRVAGIRHAIPKPIRWTQLYELMAEIPRRTSVLDLDPTNELGDARHERPVLIVEDNAVNQKVARHMLESLGYTADVVSNGVQAVEAWRRTPYVSVLMDIHMPVKNGFDATRDIRRLEVDSDTHTPIIAMTVDVLPADRKRCRDAGMDAHLPKPMQIETLEPLLRYWTAMGQRERTPPSS